MQGLIAKRLSRKHKNYKVAGAALCKTASTHDASKHALRKQAHMTRANTNCASKQAHFAQASTHGTSMAHTAQACRHSSKNITEYPVVVSIQVA